MSLRFAKRFTGNFISNIVYFLVNALVGLALVPFFINTLGEAAYGLIPLATSITSYVTLVIDSLNQSVSRFLTIDIQRGNLQKANETFNTSFFGVCAFSLIILPVGLLIASLIPPFFNIGAESTLTVSILFVMICFSALIRAVSSSFMVVLFAENRLDYRNIVNTANILLQIVFIVVFFMSFSPSLVFVGLSYLLSAIFSSLLSIILSRKVNPSLKIRIRDFKKESFKEISGVAIWNGFNAMGWLINSQIGLLVVNKLFGDVAGAQYSICIMWDTMLMGIAWMLTNTFTPMIYAYYSNNDSDGLIKFASFSIKIAGLVMILPIGLVYIYTPELMTIWVGSEYAGLSPIIWIILLPMIFRVQASCVTLINVAYKCVRIPALANLFAGFLNLSLSLILSSVMDMGVYGVAWAYAISVFFLSGCFTPIYNAYVAHASLFHFIKLMGKTLLLFLGFVVTGVICTTVFSTTHLISLLLVSSSLSVGYGIFALYGILKKSERKMIRSCLPAGIERRLPLWFL